MLVTPGAPNCASQCSSPGTARNENAEVRNSTAKAAAMGSRIGVSFIAVPFYRVTAGPERVFACAASLRIAIAGGHPLSPACCQHEASDGFHIAALDEAPER